MVDICIYHMVCLILFQLGQTVGEIPLDMEVIEDPDTGKRLYTFCVLISRDYPLPIEEFADRLEAYSHYSKVKPFFCGYQLLPVFQDISILYITVSI